MTEQALSLDPSSPTPTEPAPPTPEAVASASATLAEMNANLNDAMIPAWHPDREKWVSKKLAAYSVILAAKNRPATPSGPTPGQLLAATDEAKALRARWAALPEGHPEGDVIAARLQELTQITHHAELSRPAPGAFTPADVERATKEAGLTEIGRVQFEAAAARLGASHQEAVQFAWALRDSEPDDTLTAEAVSVRLDEWWGADADANLSHAERAWTKLTKAERVALTPFRGSRPLMEELVKLGRRLAGARRGPR